MENKEFNDILENAVVIRKYSNNEHVMTEIRANDGYKIKPKIAVDEGEEVENIYSKRMIFNSKYEEQAFNDITLVKEEEE